MSDLSLPPSSTLPAQAAGFAWPTPDLPGYPAATPLAAGARCTVEGLNGRALEGRIAEFDPGRGLLLAMPAPRKPMALRLDQFRRLCLTAPLASAADGASGFGAATGQPFTVQMHRGEHWEGHTLGHREEPCGLFIFEPLDDKGTVRRWFVPRAAYAEAEVGPRLGDALVAQHSATPEQIRSALAEQEALRTRRLGDLLVVRQIIMPHELVTAIDEQARMPMVRIGEALTALGYVTQAQLDEALVQQRDDRSTPLGEILVRRGLVSRADLQIALARKMGYPLVDAMQFPADAEAASRLPFAVAQRVSALPLMMCAGRLVVAVEDPSDRSKLDEIEFAAQCKVVAVLARAGTLAAAIERAYEKVGAFEAAARSGADAGGMALDFGAADASRLLASMERVDGHADDTEDVALEQSDNTLVRLINSMIVEAHSQGVSDIHVECPGGREKVRIRFRKDGQLKPYLELPPTYRSALIARLKIMCDLDISERRKPQDGKINFAKFVAGVKLELRVATIPTQGNLEDAVLRLLASTKPLPLVSLGLSPANLQRLQAAAQRPYGMLLCVGPTGSGKTTTLHSVLAGINTPERKIWTAEDPIEITQAGLRQVQVNPRIDWTFAKALRSFLRADPDVIMVGEIRDKETAQVAIESSLTGHLVLSTLHTNSAPETVTRLLDMGMDPFNFADALLGVLAQRLVRRLCPQCRTAREATAAEEDELLHDWLHGGGTTAAAPASAPTHARATDAGALNAVALDPDALRADWRARHAHAGGSGRIARWHAPGCEHCAGTGLRGRAGIHELMTVSRTLRHLIQTGRRTEELQQCAAAEGMRTLRQDGIEKVLAGVTTVEEVRAST